MPFLRYTLVLLLVICFNPLYSQYKGRPYVINHQIDRFRLDNQNWSIANNDQGMTYIGNNQGLIAYDGANWNRYEMPGQMVVRSVATAGDSLIFVGSYEEFGYWKKDHRGRMTYHNLSDTLDSSLFHNDEIWRIIPHQGKVYFQSFSNIYVYDGQSIETITPDNPIVLLMKARDRLFVHMVDQGLFELKNNQLQFVEGSEKLASDEIKLIIPFKEKKFLIGASSGGLFVYNGTTFRRWDIPAAREIRNAEINVGLSVGQLKVIGTVVNGIYILNENGAIREHLHAGNFLRNNTILSLSSDSRGNIWAGLDRGLDYINLNSVLDFYVHPSRNIGSAYTALLDDQQLYLGTNQGLFRYSYSRGKGFSNPQLIAGSQGQVWDLEKAGNELLCGHTNGTFKIEQEQLIKISDVNGGFDLLTLTRNNQKYLLQSTYSSLVLYEKAPHGWQYLRSLAGFLEPVSDIESDHLGHIWGTHTQKGVFRFRINQSLDSVVDVTYFGKDRGFPTERHIRMSKIQKRIVFATSRSLYTYDDLNDSIIPYRSLNQRLPIFHKARQIKKATPDHAWFIHNGQIGLFNLYEEKTKRDFYFDLSRLDLYLISNHPNIVHLKDSLHLICLDKGFATLSQRRASENKRPPRVTFRKAIATSPKKKNQSFLPLKPTDPPTHLSYRQRNLQFIFSCRQPTLYPQFRYRLKGLKDKWSCWAKNSHIHFTRLPWGRYTLQLQARNPQGIKGPVARYSFYIKPPWYASKPAWVFYGLLVISSGILLRKIFVRRLKKHKNRIEQEERNKRKREQMQEQQKYMKLRNEKLQNEIAHKSYQLANYTMTILRKNEHLTHLKEEVQKQKKELGPRFPNYYYRRLLQMIDRGISSEEDWKQFEYHFDQAHENFIKRLKKHYPHLTQADLKLCAYLRLNLSTKEIAPLLNISIRGVEVRRYRLRKRLNLSKEDNLVEFLLNF